MPIEHPAEVILKKLFHRARLLKPRDIFDTAVVLASDHAEALTARLHCVSSKKADLLARMTTLPDGYFDAAMEELAIFPDWAHVIPTARARVTDLIKAIPAV